MRIRLAYASNLCQKRVGHAGESGELAAGMGPGDYGRTSFKKTLTVSGWLMTRIWPAFGTTCVGWVKRMGNTRSFVPWIMVCAHARYEIDVQKPVVKGLKIIHFSYEMARGRI
jgi:hypothetical protein